MDKRNRAGTRRQFLTAGAIGLLGGTVGVARGAEAQVVEITEDGTVLSTLSSSAAKWISPSTLRASSLETGRIGYVVAWGGDEYGHAYTYALQGAPDRTTIDTDTGILSIGSR